MLVVPYISDLFAKGVLNVTSWANSEDNALGFHFERWTSAILTFDSPKCCTPTWHAYSVSHRRAKSEVMLLQSEFGSTLDSSSGTVNWLAFIFSYSRLFTAVAHACFIWFYLCYPDRSTRDHSPPQCDWPSNSSRIPSHISTRSKIAS